MIEIRTIREDEATQFLEVLCEVFDLDFNRAQGVFFQEPGFDLNRKWALFEAGKMVSILTTSPLQFGVLHGSGIAGVATLPAARGRGFARRLIEASTRAGEFHGESFQMLFARDPALYSEIGFEIVDEVHEGVVARSNEILPEESLPFAEVQARYEAWAKQDPRRLTRTTLRWNLWRWSMRACAEWGEGYVCFEGTQVREVVRREGGPLPVPERTQWSGLLQTSEHIGVEFEASPTGLFLMTRGLGFVPVMFMTDQF